MNLLHVFEVIQDGQALHSLAQTLFACLRVVVVLCVCSEAKSIELANMAKTKKFR